MKDQLHERLETLTSKIDDKVAALKLKQSWHDGHELSVKEMKEKYQFLKSQLDEQIQELETHDHYVTVLERDVLNWIDVLNA